MPTFEIQVPGGGRFQVTAPDEKAAIAALQQQSASPPAAAAPEPAKQPDKYQQAALDERAALKPGDAGLTRRLVHGATLGADNTIMAALETPLEMIRQGTFDPREGYNYAKAREDLALDEARKNTGALGTAAEVLGGGVTGAGLASGGLTTARMLAPEAGLLTRTASSAADAAGFGGFSGAMEGNGLEERAANAAKGAAVGAAAGGLIPPALALGGAAVAPVVSNIRARVNPAGYAEGQVVRAIQESGRPVSEITQDMIDAHAAGQPFMLADALGNSGQRMLSTVARSPGEGRTAVIEALQNRQAGQAQRVSQITDEALGADSTARQTVDQLTRQARADSAPLYAEALDHGPVWNERLQQFFSDPVAQRGLREGVAVQRLEALAEGRPFNPQDYAITGFNEAGDPILSGVPNMRTINLLKKGWDNILEGYRDGTTGRLNLDEYGRALDNVRRSFLREVDSVNPVYGEARRVYAGPAQVREAVQTGADAATRGRSADNIARFEAMGEPAKQGYRTGYADTLAARAEKGAEGVNKVRPLTSDKARAELGALSLHQGPNMPGRLDPMQRLLDREQTMFKTGHEALGGSKTADNLADDMAMGMEPQAVVGLVKNVLTGNIGGAVKDVTTAVANGWNGNTAAVRKEVANILLRRAPNINAQALENLVDQTIQRIQRVQQIARQIGRGGAGALAVETAGANRRQ
jgi:hypothetical protein